MNSEGDSLPSVLTRFLGNPTRLPLLDTTKMRLIDCSVLTQTTFSPFTLLIVSYLVPFESTGSLPGRSKCVGFRPVIPIWSQLRVTKTSRSDFHDSQNTDLPSLRGEPAAIAVPICSVVWFANCSCL